MLVSVKDKIKIRNKTPKVAVFDSGVGGVAILKAIQKKLPGVELIFCCDDDFFPYGDRTELQILERVEKVVGRLIQQQEIDLLVIACNTASTTVLEPLRAQFSFPIVGVVPAVKPATFISASKKIGVVATPATISQPYLSNLVEEFAQDCEVSYLPAKNLARYAEDKIRHNVIDIIGIKKELEPLFDEEGIDTVILGCTHYIHLCKELKLLYPHIHWVDSSPWIANRVESVLKTQFKWEELSPSSKTIHGFCTKRAEKDEELVHCWFQKFSITSLEFLPA